MSRSRDLDEDTDMAISYASRAPAGHPQTLPSFREVSKITPLPQCAILGSPLTTYIGSSSHRTFTMRSTPPRHIILPVTNRRSVLPPVMKWQPIPDQYPDILQTPLRKLPMASIPANIQRAQASTHPDRWATTYL